MSNEPSVDWKCADTLEKEARRGYAVLLLRVYRIDE